MGLNRGERCHIYFGILARIHLPLSGVPLYIHHLVRPRRPLSGRYRDGQLVLTSLCLARHNQRRGLSSHPEKMKSIAELDDGRKSNDSLTPISLLRNSALWLAAYEMLPTSCERDR